MQLSQYNSIHFGSFFFCSSIYFASKTILVVVCFEKDCIQHHLMGSKSDVTLSVAFLLQVRRTAESPLSAEQKKYCDSFVFHQGGLYTQLLRVRVSLILAHAVTFFFPSTYGRQSSVIGLCINKTKQIDKPNTCDAMKRKHKGAVCAKRDHMARGCGFTFKLLTSRTLRCEDQLVATVTPLLSFPPFPSCLLVLSFGFLLRGFFLFLFLSCLVARSLSSVAVAVTGKGLRKPREVLKAVKVPVLRGV